MKIYKVRTHDGLIKDMTLTKVIARKRAGKPVTIIGVSKIINKSNNKNT